jgi:hypothetical protein
MVEKTNGTVVEEVGMTQYKAWLSVTCYHIYVFTFGSAYVP